MEEYNPQKSNFFGLLFSSVNEVEVTLGGDRETWLSL